MKLNSIQITDFRNLNNVSISLHPSLNLIIGKNGSGKSSLLEAVHYLGYGRSFRTAKHQSVIQHDRKAFFIHGKVIGSEGRELSPVGLSRALNGDVDVSIEGEKGRRLSDLVSLLPIQIFTPQSSDLIIGAPSLRRKFLDWAVFHVEHSFNAVNVNFSKALKHRNALLKQIQKSPETLESKRPELNYWSEVTAKYGNQLHKMREAIFEELTTHLKRNLGQFVTEFCVEISYHRGWDSKEDLLESLSQKTPMDIKYGFTSIGPQKCDLTIKADSNTAAEVLSRGQLRMLVASMQLSQSEYLAERTGKQSVFLIDDVAAELDQTKRHAFVDILLACDAQVILTAIDASQVSFLEAHNNKKVFHVEHGQVNEE